MPCLAFRRGFYVLPTPENGIFYGLVFPTRLPDAYAAAFESLVRPHCLLRALSAEQAREAAAQLEAPPPPKPLSVRAIDSVSTGVGYGTTRLAQGVAATGSWLAGCVSVCLSVSLLSVSSRPTPCAAASARAARRCARVWRRLQSRSSLRRRCDAFLAGCSLANATPNCADEVGGGRHCQRDTASRVC